MTATLQLNFGNSLNADELHELAAIVRDRNTTLERVIYEAASERAQKAKDARNNNPQPVRTEA